MKIKRNQLLPYVGFTLMEVETWLFTVVSKNWFYWLKVLTVILLLVGIFFHKWPIKEIVSKALFCLLTVGIYVKCKDDTLLYFAIALTTMQDVDFKVIAKIDIVIKSICMPIVFSLYFLGIIPSYDIIEPGIARYTLGYFNPNGLFFGVLVVCLDILILAGDNLQTRDFFVLALIGMIFGLVTGCRTGVLVLCAIIFVFYLKRKYNYENNKILTILITYSVPILCVLSYLCVVLYKMKIAGIISLDKLMTGRIRFASEFFDKYGISLLGQSIFTATGLEAVLNRARAYSLDNYYMYCLIAYGLVYSMVLIFISVIAQKNLAKRKMFSYSIILSFLAIYSLSEKIYTIFESNIWTILLCAAWWNDESLIRREE